MSSSLFAQGNAILPVTGVDLSAATGKLVKFTAGVPAVHDSATVPAVGIVLEGNVAAKQSSIGILGALDAPVLVLIASDASALSFGDKIQQKADGTFTNDAGAGTARVLCGVITDPAGAVAGQLVAAQLIRPVAIAGSVASAVTQTSNATIAGTHSTAVNPTKADFDLLLAEAGKLQADFYVLRAALVTQGIITAP